MKKKARPRPERPRKLTLNKLIQGFVEGTLRDGDRWDTFPCPTFHDNQLVVYETPIARRVAAPDGKAAFCLVVKDFTKVQELPARWFARGVLTETERNGYRQREHDYHPRTVFLPTLDASCDDAYAALAVFGSTAFKKAMHKSANIWRSNYCLREYERLLEHTWRWARILHHAKVRPQLPAEAVAAITYRKLTPRKVADWQKDYLKTYNTLIKKLLTQWSAPKED